MKIFKISGFTPYLIIMFLNILTDIGHKIIIRNTIIKNFEGTETTALIAIVNALILLPFILLLTPSGYLSDKFPKHLVIKYSAIASIILAILITISYYIGAFWLSFTFTFALAVQSAIYSPAKYGYIRELVGKEQIATANGFVQSITIIGILFSSFLFSIFFEGLYKGATDTVLTLQNIAPLGFLLIIFTVIESILSFRLLDKSYIDKTLKFDIDKYLKFQYLRSSFTDVTKKEAIWLSIIGLAVFWSVGQTIDSAFPTYAKEYLDSDNTIFIHGIMAVAGLGIMVGSLTSGRISKNYIELGTIPISAIGISTVIFILPYTSQTWILTILFFLFGYFGGLFIVPLNSLIQFHAKDNNLGKVLATNNFIQNISMLLFLGLIIIFSELGVSSRAIFTFIGFVALIGAIYTIYKLPQSLLQYLILFVISKKYNLSVCGLKNLPANGGVLLLGNHISWLDWAVLQMASPRKIRFVMERSIYEKWYLKRFLDFFRVIPISSRASAHSLKIVGKILDKGEIVALFPEGHISRNGHLGEFFKGYELALKEVKNSIVIVPFYLRGLWGGTFSNSEYKTNELLSFKSKNVSVTFGEAISKDTKVNELKQKIYELSIKSWDLYSSSLNPIHISWLKTAKKSLNSLSIAELPNNRLSRGRVLTGAILFSKLFSKKKEQNIGIILPPTPIGAITNLSVMMLGKIVVNLNYTLGSEVLLKTVKKAELKTIYTSKKFMTKLKARGFDIEKTFENVELIFMEDLKNEIGKIEAIWTMIKVKFLPTPILQWLYFKDVDINSTVAIIFSSGSEGTPKGIELSHKNIMGNIKQIAEVLTPTPKDVVVASLPIFHSLGFTVTTMMPLVEGIPLATHPDPTDGFSIGKLVARFEATMLFGTGTFFRLYSKNRRLTPLMFKSLKLVIAGAEKLRKDVKNEFKEKFGLDIYEGYGATETSPVASCNIPDVLNKSTFRVQIGNKFGTVGTPLPGSRFKIVNPDNLKELPIGEEGLILIGGIQVMKGYFKDKQKTDENITYINNLRWYKSGDKGKIDKDGFLTIVDRYSRFAKIGGEMISLTLVEDVLSKILSRDIEYCAVNIPDSKKGEKIALLYTGDLEIGEITKIVLQSDIEPLIKPAKYMKIDKIPKSGTGKIDFKTSKEYMLKNLTL